MQLTHGLFDLLQEDSPGITTDYELLKALVKLIAAKEYGGETLRIRLKQVNYKYFLRTRSSMVNSNMLRPMNGFGAGAYQFPGAKKRPIEELCCFIDPFCYLSHFSALQRYRLTLRNPAVMNFSTPERTRWKSLKEDMIENDFEGSDPETEIATTLFKKTAFREKISRQQVIRHNTKYVANTTKIRGTYARISSIGDTFLDTVEKPDWCGGMAHVLDIWKEHALKYQNDIIEAVDRGCSKIAAVRAGYIFDEVLGVEDVRINAWTHFAARGSSRKLDPQVDYAPTFSEKWMISINV